MIETDKDIRNKTVQTAEEIKNKNKKEKQEYLDLAAAYYANDLKVTRENDKNKIQKVLSATWDGKPKDLKIVDKHDIEDIFIDDKFLSINVGGYQKKFTHDLIKRTDFLHIGEIDFEKFKPEIRTKNLNWWT